MNDLDHLAHAVRLAQAARDRGDHPFGAIVVTPAGTIVEGMNSVLTQSDPTGHAETNLVRAAGAALVVTVMQVTSAALALDGPEATAPTGDGVRAGLLVASALATGLVALSLFVRRPQEADEPVAPDVAPAPADLRR